MIKNSFPEVVQHNQSAMSVFSNIKELLFSKSVLFQMEFFSCLLKCLSHNKNIFEVRSFNLKYSFLISASFKQAKSFSKSFTNLISGSVLSKKPKV